MLLPNELPAPHEIRERPELAALTILDFAVEAATYAVAIAHPGGSWACQVDTTEHSRTRECLWAHQIIIASLELQELVDRYRWRGDDHTRSSTDDIPADAPF